MLTWLAIGYLLSGIMAFALFWIVELEDKIKNKTLTYGQLIMYWAGTVLPVINTFFALGLVLLLILTGLYYLADMKIWSTRVYKGEWK